MSTTTSWSGSWLRTTLCKGNGFSVLCTVKEERVHSVFLSKPSTNPAELSEQLPTRFTVFVVEVKAAFQRLFVSNREIEPGKAVTTKKVKDPEPESVSIDKLCTALGAGSAFPLPPGFLDSRKDKLHPKTANIFEFWADVEKPAFKGIVVGEELMLKTIGDSIFVDLVQRLNAKDVVFKSAEHKELGAGWAGRILSNAEPEKKVEDTREGVADDEWDDE